MGFFISMGEDPEVMLQDAIEDMRITMPKLNMVLVATRATVIRLEEERDQLRRQGKNLSASIQAALRADR
jgi:phage shock protein A